MLYKKRACTVYTWLFRMDTSKEIKMPNLQMMTYTYEIRRFQPGHENVASCIGWSSVHANIQGSRCVVLELKKYVAIVPRHLVCNSGGWLRIIYRSGCSALVQVWTSYHNTIHRKNIHSIPYFVFTLNVQGGGPFRQGSGREFKVHGSANAQTFNDVFESLWQEQQKAAKVTNNQGSEKKTGSGEKGIRRGFLG